LVDQRIDQGVDFLRLRFRSDEPQDHAQREQRVGAHLVAAVEDLLRMQRIEHRLLRQEWPAVVLPDRRNLRRYAALPLRHGLSPVVSTSHSVAIGLRWRRSKSNPRERFSLSCDTGRATEFNHLSFRLGRSK
jgi:hypothetical protein